MADKKKIKPTSMIRQNVTSAIQLLKLKYISPPNVHIPTYDRSLCKFLKSRDEVNACTSFLRCNGYLSHAVTCKDWDLAHIIPEIGDGNFLDMGSSESYILKNISLKKIRGYKYGIDLRPPDVPVKGVKYIVGDLMDARLPNNYFKNITCLSVIEHEVDLSIFARGVARLLEEGGRLFVTFDYWTPKVVPPIKMYGLSWQPLDDKMLEQFIDICGQYNLQLVQNMDWSVGDAVIQHNYYSPHPDIKYTFGLVVFEKKSAA